MLSMFARRNDSSFSFLQPCHIAEKKSTLPRKMPRHIILSTSILFLDFGQNSGHDIRQRRNLLVLASHSRVVNREKRST